MKKGSVGALILFIALIFITTIAAGVMLQTSFSLQNSALKTGQEVQKSITSSANIQSIIGKINDEGSIEKLFVRIQVPASGNTLDLDNINIKFDTDNSSKLYLHKRTIENCQDKELFDNVFYSEFLYKRRSVSISDSYSYMEFDGIDDFVSISTIDFGNSDFEWDVSFKPMTFSSNVIFGRGGLSTLRLNSASQFLMLDYNNINNFIFALKSNLEIGKEYKLKITRENNELKLYLNNILQDTNIVTSNDYFGINTIGKRSTLNYFNGTIYDINIDNIAYYEGYSNTNEDWIDLIGSNDGNINGNPNIFTSPNYSNLNSQSVTIASPGDVILLCFNIENLTENKEGIIRLFGKNLIPDFTQFSTLSSQTTKFATLYP